jgi:16S rRNA (guanine(966)-N(2))-methyltransferase RsmD
MPDAGRVIGGTARSIRLEAPGPGTRPLADRVKQTLFAILEPDLPGARFLDLFAGSGAAGIEALSRGAGEAIFVEHDRTAVQVIHANLDRTDLAATERATVVRADALQWLRDPERTSERPIDIAVVDPPYDDREALTTALEALGPLLAKRARVVAKHFWRDAPPPQIGLLASERQRRFGETALTFYRRQESAVRPGDTTEGA